MTLPILTKKSGSIIIFTIGIFLLLFIYFTSQSLGTVTPNDTLVLKMHLSKADIMGRLEDVSASPLTNEEKRKIFNELSSPEYSNTPFTDEEQLEILRYVHN